MPTDRMRRRAEHSLCDVVILQTVSENTPTISTLATAGETLGTQFRYAARVMAETESREASITVERNVRDLRVWLSENDQVHAGMRCTFEKVDDPDLVGEYGTVVEVERGSHRALRRITVRMSNDG